MQQLDAVQTDLENMPLAQFEEAVTRAQNIVIVCHKSPDGDALGATLALFQALRHMGKKVTALCWDAVPDAFRFLPESSRIARDFDPATCDLFITMDCGDSRQTKFNEKYPVLFAPKEERKHTLVKIDHHAYGEDFGDIQIVPTDMPASCYIVARMLRKLHLPITPDIATCLLTGLYTDTGGLKHSNASAQAHRVASDLIRSGANLAALSRNVFRRIPINAMHLWGKILRDIEVNEKGVTVAVVKKTDFEATETEAEDLTGVVDYVNAVPDTLFSLMLSERGDVIKGSLRTKRDDVNVAEIAKAFGGGGHIKAAGFAVKGTLKKETVWKVVEDGEERDLPM